MQEQSIEIQPPETHYNAPENTPLTTTENGAGTTARNLHVEGKTNPAGLTNPAPEFSWEYEDPQGLPQNAWQLIVASTQELLADNIGDLWDSGVVLSRATNTVYNGQALTELTIYFWKIRVRNTEGAWSEEW